MNSHSCLYSASFTHPNLIVTVGASMDNILGAFNAEWYKATWPKSQQAEH